MNKRTKEACSVSKWCISGLTKEAVSALQATEDYTKVELKAGHTQKAVKEVVGGKEQVQDTLLLQIKGKNKING